MVARMLAVVFFTFFLAVPASAETIEQIPTPRPVGWVTDLTGTLRPDSISTINIIGDRLYSKHKAEMAVVLIRSTNGESPRAFATRLFNFWGIGRASANNGILILVATKDRKAEIILGKGLEQFVGITDGVMADIIVPGFKAGNPDRALVKAADACVEKIFNSRRPGSLNPSVYKDPWFLALGGFTVVMLMVAGRYLWRYRRRKCSDCGSRMLLVSEKKDDLLLKKFQRMEEKIGSVDYDVWACLKCANTSVERYTAFFTSYEDCPKCQARTAEETGSKVIERATEYRSGTELVYLTCIFCGHEFQERREIPQLSNDTTSGSDSSSGFSGGGSSGVGSSGSW